MFSFFLDASALAKRYTPELGTPLVNHLFSRVRTDRMHTLNVGAAEVVSVIVRKRNAGRMSAAAVLQALSDVGAEVLYSAAFSKVEVDNRLMIAAVPFITAYSINSTDAIVLRAALDLAAQYRRTGDDLALVSSDHGLLKAARAEGLVTFDPETPSQADLDALIGP